MKIRIDSEKCQGHARCYSMAPQLYDLDAIGHGVVLMEIVPSQLEALAETSVANCPEGAITIEK